MDPQKPEYPLFSCQVQTLQSMHDKRHNSFINEDRSEPLDLFMQQIKQAQGRRTPMCGLFNGMKK